MTGHLSEVQIEEILHNTVIGRLGCTDGHDVYVVPINFLYDGNYIIAHAIEGRKISMMRKNPRVCFEVDEIRSSTDWRSVIVTGVYEELIEEKDKYEAMQLFVEQAIRLKISETAQLPEMTGNRIHPRSPGAIRPVIYRICIIQKTGRYETD